MTRVLSTTKLLAVAGCGGVLLLGACSKAGSAVATGTGSAVAVSTSDACSLLTKDEVAAATGKSVDFTKQATTSSGKACTFGSVSGSAVVLSVTSTPAAGLTGDIPGFGNLTTRYHMTQVSGIGDQAYAGPNTLIASKGSTLIFLLAINVSGGNEEQALETMAKDVFARV